MAQRRNPTFPVSRHAAVAKAHYEAQRGVRRRRPRVEPSRFVRCGRTRPPSRSRPRRPQQHGSGHPSSAAASRPSPFPGNPHARKLNCYASTEERKRDRSDIGNRGKQRWAVTSRWPPRPAARCPADPASGTPIPGPDAWQSVSAIPSRHTAARAGRCGVAPPTRSRCRRD